MSFQKRIRKVDIPGTRQSLHNGQTLVSTGNPSLDYILGGGQQLGTILLIEEDKYGSYAQTLSKYYMAEGIIQKHGLFTASLEEDPKNIIKKLPAPILETNIPKGTDDTVSQLSENMRIAWRYNNLPQVDSVEESKSNLGHHFDLSMTIEDSMLEKGDLYFWNGETNQSAQMQKKFIQNEHLNSCCKSLHEISQKYPAETSNNVMRIVINSLASPYWYSENIKGDLIRFLNVLKSIVRHTTTVCFITIPMHLLRHINEEIVNKVRTIVDYSIELESFAGSDKETNPVFKDYHGLLYVRRIKAVNCSVAYTPKIQDLAFKLRRKKFVIEKLHLPPELQESDQREQDDIVPTVSCVGKAKNLLDF